MRAAAIECQDIVKTYADSRVLNSICLTVPEASLFFLLGPSGCGKTTLLRIIAGLETADSGKLYIAGKEASDIPPERRGLGMVFQNYGLWPHMNVYQHLEFGLANSVLSKHEIDQRIRSVLGMLQISSLADRMPAQLSGGQQQRVSLARALALQPKVLLLDEPLSNLDPYLREEMRSELKAVQRELGLTFIYVTHDRAEALAIGDQVAFMSAGQIVQQGRPAELYYQPENLEVASFLGEMNVFEMERTFMIRPEDIRINDANQSDYSFDARIISIVHLGYGSQVSLELESGSGVKALIAMKQAVDLKEKDTVKLSFNRQDLKILER